MTDADAAPSSVGVVVVAAGSGSRLGADVPKAFVHLHGRPLLAHELAPFDAALLDPPRHEFQISENVAREFRNKSLLAIQKDPGDEIIEPA